MVKPNYSIVIRIFSYCLSEDIDVFVFQDGLNAIGGQNFPIYGLIDLLINNKDTRIAELEKELGQPNKPHKQAHQLEPENRVSMITSTML